MEKGHGPEFTFYPYRAYYNTDSLLVCLTLYLWQCMNHGLIKCHWFWYNGYPFGNLIVLHVSYCVISWHMTWKSNCLISNYGGSVCYQRTVFFISGIIVSAVSCISKDVDGNAMKQWNIDTFSGNICQIWGKSDRYLIYFTIPCAVESYLTLHMIWSCKYILMLDIYHCGCVNAHFILPWAEYRSLCAIEQ